MNKNNIQIKFTHGHWTLEQLKELDNYLNELNYNRLFEVGEVLCFSTYSNSRISDFKVVATNNVNVLIIEEI